VPGRDC